MKMRFKLAFRNILRHRSRTLVSLSMIAGAVIGLVIFAGFANYVLKGLRDVVINNEYGHLQIGDHAFWELTPGSRKNQLIGNADELSRRVAADPEVESVSGRLSFFGLASTGDITVSAKGVGYDPAKELQFGKSLKLSSGERLNQASRLETVMGLGLQRRLKLKVGDTMTVVGYTLDGVVNAMDLTVKGVFVTGNGDIDNNVFMMPLSTVQTLLDTDRVEVLSIRVRETDRTDAVRARIQDIAAAIKPSYETKTWLELSSYYRQVMGFFRIQNRVIQLILLSLVFMGIMNTIGMSVFERTGEIGTARALGETGMTIIGQFTLEGVMLGLMGAILGGVLGYLIGALISSLNIWMELPGTTAAVPIKIRGLPMDYVHAMLVVSFAATIATWIPSIRASRLAIVEALRKNV